VLAAWERLPDRCRKPKTDPDQALSEIALTPEIRAQLRGHWMRVGLPVVAFFRGLADPSGLSAAMILRWMGDAAPRNVRKDHLEFVLAEWGKLPDGMGRLNRMHFLPFAGARKNLENSDTKPYML
jgi:hypothetical protein